MSDRTLAVMVDYLRLEQQIGGYEAAAEEAENLERFYQSAGRLVGGEPENIAFADSATRAWNTIIFSMELKPGEKIVTTTTEFGSNVVSLQSLAERSGAQLVILEVRDNGHIDIDEFTKHVDESLKLVAVSHAPAHCGSVLNVKQIGEKVKDCSAFFLLDACQTLGQFDVSVKAIGCDALVGTGRKWLRGPRGTGIIYANDRISNSLRSISIDLANADWLAEPKNGSQIEFFKKAQRLQTWERSLAGQLGLTNAIKEYLQANASGKVTSQIADYRSIAHEAVAKNKNLTLYPAGNTESGVVSFYSKSMPADEIKKRYADKSINVSTMSNWDAPWDFAQKNLPTLVRVSPHYYNSKRELQKFSKVTESL